LLSAGNRLKSTETWPVSGPLSKYHQRQLANPLCGKIIDQLYKCTFHIKIIELNTILLLRGRNNAVGVVTGYGLEILGIESRWRARFSAHAQTCPGDHPSSCTMGTGPLCQG